MLISCRFLYKNQLTIFIIFFQQSSLLISTILVATCWSSVLGMENVVYTSNGAVCGPCSTQYTTSQQQRTINPPSLTFTPPYLAQSRVVNKQYTPSGDHKITTTTYYTDYTTGAKSDTNVISGSAGTNTIDSKYNIIAQLKHIF